MGCTSSKQAHRDRRRRSPPPLPRSHSMVELHPVNPNSGGDDHVHVVALKSIKLDARRSDVSPYLDGVNDDDEPKAPPASPEMVEKKIVPKTPTMTPPNEPAETIDAWELMEGLEDITPLRPSSAALDHRRSFSFRVVVEEAAIPEKESKDFIIPEFEPEIIAAFRKALEELSPPKMAVRVQLECTGDEVARRTPDLTGIVRARIVEFQKRINEKKATPETAITPSKCPSAGGGEGKVVLYFTSLRGIRKTYEDCSEVRTILRGYGIGVDERDVSMHAAFKDELNEMLGEQFTGGRLPALFADGEYLGGAEEVRRLHEAGELEKSLEGCAAAGMGKGGGGAVPCQGCGDVRFVPCGRCSGSCKLYVEEEDAEDEDAGDGGGGGWFWWRCPDCNENGIVRCPLCC